MRSLKLLILFILTLHFGSTYAQNNIIKGTILNGFTKEPIPFSSVRWKIQQTGSVCDSIGNYTVKISSDPTDSLIVESVGFEPIKYAINDIKKLGNRLTLETLSKNEGIVVKTKFNKGLRWWKQVVANKQNNNPFLYPKYKCELYNKLELDLNNVNKNSFSNIGFLKPFSFILDNIDSVSDEKPFLPILMSENISDYYYSSTPNKTREIVKGSTTHGIKSENVMQLIGNLNQNVNVYEDYIKILGKEFISPLSIYADKYYNFKGADTQYIQGIKVFHLLFSPLNIGENTFAGDAWIDASSYAIKRINLNISKTADINFVNRLNISQEFDKLANGKYIFSKDKINADLSPLPKDRLTLIVRKSNSYQKFNFAENEVDDNLKLNKKQYEIVYLEDAATHPISYWSAIRHDTLNRNEQRILQMIDTLKSIPLFKEYTRNIEFLVDGHRKFGIIEIGPWYKWVSGNQYERTRLRFDLGTTEKFSKNLRLYGYLAYGTRDREFKEQIGLLYKFKSIKGLSLEASYLKDLDNGRVRFSEEDMTTDNIFSQIFRRPGIPQKFLGQEEMKMGINKDWESGISNSINISRTDYEPLTPLPNRNLFTNGKIINGQITYRIRYAPGERKFANNRRTIRFKSNKPVYEMSIGQGIDGLFGGNYNYTKLHAAVSQQVRLPNFGTIKYNAYAGKIYGDSLPFMLLELHPGNEVYVYNKNGFNLMNRFEYFSDTYIGFQMEHNIEKKIINLLPLLKRTKIRQFWNIKGVWGNMNNSNKVLNRTELGSYQLRSLREHAYLEFGTGFDNIFKFFRIDFVWRKAPPLPPNQANNTMQPAQNFGVFGSFRIQF
jgi:cell fate (sporulation/competence/biofilm development) regulator YmcA (YheA/YmcA/DUF963 family)